MKRLLPGRMELALLAALAAICTIAVGFSPRQDVGLMFAGMPLFLVASLMGFRRNQIVRAEAIAATAEGCEEDPRAVR